MNLPARQKIKDLILTTCRTLGLRLDAPHRKGGSKGKKSMWAGLNQEEICRKKVNYTAEEAIDMALEFGQFPYKCPWCEEYHLTSKKPRR